MRAFARAMGIAKYMETVGKRQEHGGRTSINAEPRTTLYDDWP